MTRPTFSVTRRPPTAIRCRTSTGTCSVIKSAAGQAAARYEQSNPAWAQAFHVLADTPGSGSYRFWMWNQPTTSIATTVEKWFADAEQAQPNTTVQLTMYNLVHSNVDAERDPEPVRSLDLAVRRRASATSGRSSTWRRTR